jgi:hypothetical protein
LNNHADKEKLVELLLTPCSLTPEHAVLARLLGTWQAQGKWYYIPGRESIPVQTVMTNTALYGGLYIESNVSLETEVASRAIFGYDPEQERYVACAFSSLVARIDHELGQYHRRSDTLTFAGTEPFPGTDKTIRYERKFTFRGPAAIDFELVYPDMAPGRQQGMFVRLERR